MADEYRQELAAIEKSSSVVLGPKDADLASEDGIWARFQRWKARSADLKAGYDATLQAVSGWSRTIVKLIALFVVHPCCSLSPSYGWLGGLRALQCAGQSQSLETRAMPRRPAKELDAVSTAACVGI